jgi:hypothetical protein
LFSVGLAWVMIPSVVWAAEAHQHPDATEKLGTVSFSISCAPGMQTEFEHGVALLHSFWFDEADKQFQAIAQGDPKCAITYWGRAMSSFRQLWSIPEPADLKNGSELIRQAQAIHAATQREREYIAALAVFYRDYDRVDYYKRAQAYSHAMAKVGHGGFGLVLPFVGHGVELHLSAG